MHRHVILFGVMALLFLAVWLWDTTPCGCHGVAWADPDADAEHVAAEAKAEPVKAFVPTYDGGRTTIPPKVSPETIARIRGL